MLRRPSCALSVLLIDPSIVRSGRLMAAIGAEPSVSLLGCAVNLTQAYTVTERDSPDLVIVAAEQTLLPEFPMFAAMLDMLDVDCLILAEDRCDPVDAGAAGVVTAAEIAASGGMGSYLARRYGLRPAPADSPAALQSVTSPAAPWKTVVIGASTGGIEALLAVLSHYPADCPPTLIVQHISATYVPGLVERLDRHCAARVSVATPLSEICPGQILVAPGSAEHLTIVPPGKRCRLVAGEPISGHRPSVDALFHSAAKLGSGVVGVILTGMGRDGAEGLAAIRRVGGWTIGQDEASSTVYGMPQAAYKIGAVMQQLALDKIGPAILKLAARTAEEPAIVRR